MNYFLYNVRNQLAKIINPPIVPFEHVIFDRKVLDIGCGSYQYWYNPNKAKIRVGIDISQEFLTQAKRIYPDSVFIKASAKQLPFKDDTFDTVLMLFVLHHLSPADWQSAIQEAKRVSRESVIIYDHVLHEGLIRSLIQRLYWRIFDRGLTYVRADQWGKVLKSFKIIKYRRFGRLFDNICFYHLKVN